MVPNIVSLCIMFTRDLSYFFEPHGSRREKSAAVSVSLPHGGKNLVKLLISKYCKNNSISVESVLVLSVLVVLC